MINKTLGINLQFNADVTSAITNLRNLQQSISSIAATPMPIGTKLSAEMQTAVSSAKQLQFHLTNAFNTKTGNLDLSKLNSSLKASGQSLSTLSANLLGAGIKGEQAFINIQRAVSTANVQINTASTALGRFMITLKNTAKWQISSSLLHGFIGGIQSALTYTQDLNKSLNNIRIVTKYSSDQMVKFAEEANKAAKALNTTTVKYSDAALIYFQQGLDMDEAKKRADITVKLANVSRQSVEETSNQLTSIWSNFDDGARSLEYYADVLTKLGARTASSTQEIAGGLEKFVSIGRSIGLSFEYATAALATITANTRQSEEVVGTALKTIFARIQGLKLGETLEDGVSLNKYSQALKTIGVDILDVNNNLLSADEILKRTAEKWENLSSAQKAATAQTVAGIRQYNQFIALMENWDDGTSDSMTANLLTASGAEGELQSQADIYAESLQAAKDKLKAAGESVWNNLIPQEGFTSFINGLAEIVDTLASAIEGFGGLQSILLLIANIALTKLGPSIAVGIDQGINKMKEFGSHSVSTFKQLGGIIAHPIASLKQWWTSADATNNSFVVMKGHLDNISSGTGNVKKQIELYDTSLKSSNQSLNEAQLSISKAVNGGNNLTETFKKYAADMAQVNNLQSLISRNSHLFTAATREQLSGMQQQLLVLAEKKAQEADNLELLELEKRTIIEATNARMQSAYTSNSDGNQVALMNLGPMNEQLLAAENGWARILVAASGVDAEIVQGAQGFQLQANTISDVHQAVMGVRETSSNVISVTEEIRNIYKDTTLSTEEQSKQANILITQKIKEKTITGQIGHQLRSQLGILNGTKASTQEIDSRIRQIVNENNQVVRGFGDSNAQINNMNSNATGLVHAMEKWKMLSQEFKNKFADISTVMQNGVQSALSFGGALQGMARGASSVAMGLNSVMNFIEQIKSGDADFTTLLVSGTMALSMGLTGLMSILGGINAVYQTWNATRIISAALTAKDTNNTLENTLVKVFNIKAETAHAIAIKATSIAEAKGAKAALKYTLAQLGLNAAMLSMIGIVAGLAAAVGLLYLGYKWVYAEEEAYKKASEHARAMEENLKATQEAAQELKETLEGYDSAVDKLKECTKGTEEWKEALKDVNKQALNLIKTYPGLASMVNSEGEKAVQRNKETGQIEIADWALDELENRADESVVIAEAASIAANQNLREKKIDLDEKDFGTNLNKEKGTLAWINTRNGAVSVSGRVSQYIADNAKTLSELTPDEQKEFLNTYFESQGITANVEDWMTAIGNLGSEFDELINSIDANTEATKIENQTIAENYLQDKGFNEEVVSGEAMGEIYDQALSDAEQKLKDDGWGTKGINKATGVNVEARRVWNEYLEAAGLDAASHSLTDTTGTDKNRKFVYVDAEGNEKSVTLEQMRQTKAASDALKKLGANVQKINDDFMRLSSSTNAADRALGQLLINKNLEGATREESEALINNVKNGITLENGKVITDKNDSNMSDAEIEALLDKEFGNGKDGKISEQTAKDRGYKSKQDMIDAYRKQMEANEEAWNDALGRLPKSLQDIQGITLQTAKSMGNALTNSFQNAGKVGKESLTKVMDAINPEQMDEFLSVYNDFDWSQDNAQEKFIEALREQGIIVSEFTPGLKEFADQMVAVGQSIPGSEIDVFIDKIYKLYGVLKDLKIGDIVSDDVIQQLESYGYAIEDYAVKTYDGWKLVKDIPFEDMEEQGLERAQATRDAFVKSSAHSYILTSNGEVVQEDANLGEYALHVKGNTDDNNAVEATKGLISGLSEEELIAIFGNLEAAQAYKDQLNVSVDSDDFSREKINQGLDLINDYYVAGEAGEYDQGVNTFQASSLMNQGISKASQHESFYNDTGDISEVGIMTMQGIAAETEAGQYAMQKYNEAIEAANGNTELINKANKQFLKDLKQIETNESAEKIRDMADELKDLSGMAKKAKFGDIADELNKMFGVEGFDAEIVEEQWPLIQRMLNGDSNATAQVISLGIEWNNPEDQKFFNNLSEKDKEIFIQAYLNGGNIEEIMNVFNIPDTKMIEFQTIYDGRGLQGLIQSLTAAGYTASEVAAITSRITGFGCSVEGLDEYLDAVKYYNEVKGTGEEAHAAALMAQAWDNLSFETTEETLGNYTPSAPSGNGGGGGDSQSVKDTISEKQDAAYERKQKRLQDARKNLYAGAAAEYIKEEIKLLQKQLDILREQRKVRIDTFKETVADFNKQHPEFNIKLNADGEIENLEGLWDEIALERDKYAQQTSEEDAERVYKPIVEALQELEKGNTEIADMNDEEAAMVQEQAELTLEMITSQIDEAVDIIDQKIENLNYYQEKFLSLAWGNKQQIEAMIQGFEYQVEEMKALFEKSEVLIEGINSLNEAKRQFPAQAKMFEDAIRDYQDDLRETTEAMIDLRIEIEELTQSVLDLALGEIDTQTGRMDTYVAMLDSYNNIIDLSGRSTIDFANKTRISAMKMDLYAEKMSVLKTQMEELREATSMAEIALAERRLANDEQSVKFWENQIQMLKQEAENASSEFLSNWEETLQTAADIYEARVETAIAVMADALSPYKTLEELQEVYDRAKDIQERYFDEATKLYELNKLNRQLNLAIADENDLLAKSKLRDLQEEIYDYQQRGVNMNQHDLDIMQKKYDLRLAEIALMEAQNNKTNMRLARDASGNYSYVYDADEQKIEDATQKYEDAVQELSKLAKEYVTEVSDQLLENQTAYQDAITNLDKTATDYDEQLLNTTQYYVEKQRYLLQELNKAAEESGINFADTLYASQLGIYDYIEAYNLFENASNEMVNDLTKSHSDFQSMINETMGMAGNTWDEFGLDTGKSLDTLEGQISRLCDEIKSLVDVLMTYTKQTILMVSSWQQQYSKQWESQMATNEKVFTTDYSSGTRSSQLNQALIDIGATGIGQGGGSTFDPSKVNYNVGLGTRRQPTEEEIAKALGIPEGKSIQLRYNEDGSLYVTVYEDPEGLRAERSMYLGNDPELQAKYPIYNYSKDYQTNYTPDGQYRDNSGLVENMDSYNSSFGREGYECAGFVRDIHEAFGSTLHGGDANSTLRGNDGAQSYFDEYGNPREVPTGAAFGAFNSGHGHIMIMGDDDYLYGTVVDPSTGNRERLSIDDFLKKYGSNPVFIPATQNGDAIGSEVRWLYDYAQGFRTGGYTGDWLNSEGLKGDGGKLALLHQKELILNAKDTKNILDAVKLLRGNNLSSYIDSQVAQMISSTGLILSNLVNSVKLKDFVPQPMEQIVQINAEFPGVTDQYEIQEAFMSLTNDASQYLNSRNY